MIDDIKFINANEVYCMGGGSGGGGPSPEQLAIQRQQLQVQQQQLTLNQENFAKQSEERARRIKEDSRKERLEGQDKTKEKLTNRKNIRATSGGSVKRSGRGGQDTSSVLSGTGNDDDLLGG